MTLASLLGLRLSAGSFNKAYMRCLGVYTDYVRFKWGKLRTAGLGFWALVLGVSV